MLGWLRHRRETAERIEAEAETVMRAYAVRACAEARRREREAKTKEEAQNWSRVALVIAHKTGKRVGLDTASRMAADAIFFSDPEGSASPPRAPISGLDPLEELVRLVSKRHRKRIPHSVSRAKDRSRAGNLGGGRGPGFRRLDRDTRSGSHTLAASSDWISAGRSRWARSSWWTARRSARLMRLCTRILLRPRGQ